MGVVEGGKPGLHYKILSLPAPQPTKEMDSSRSVSVVISQLDGLSVPYPFLCLTVLITQTQYQSLVDRDKLEVGQTTKRRPFSLHVEKKRWGAEGFMYAYLRTYT